MSTVASTHSLKPVLLGFIFFSYLRGVEGSPAPITNATAAPASSNSHIHCEPTNWYDICWFVFSNYVLHALSIRSLPGENIYSSTAFKFCCLLVPYTGLRRGLCLISRASNLAGDDLQGAARANALCMVIRTRNWMPKDGDTINGCRVEMKSTDDARIASSALVQKDGHCISTTNTMASENISRTDTSNEPGISIELESMSSRERQLSNAIPREANALKPRIDDLYTRSPCQSWIDKVSRAIIETHRFRCLSLHNNIIDHKNVKIQGACLLSPGYALSYVPSDMKVYPCISPRPASAASSSRSTSREVREPPRTHIASAHDFPRILFSLTQTISGGVSLYKARGSQIDRYGFAAFGLTVVPYIIISIINFVGSLLTSEYETLFLVRSTIMDEMIDRGGSVDGVVGTIDALSEHGQELLLNKGDKRVENEGEKMIFRRRDELPSRQILADSVTTGKRYLLLPNEASPPVPVSQFQLRVPKSWKFLHFRRRANIPKKETTGPILSIPSHQSFTGLSRPPHQSYLDWLCLALLIIAVSTPYVVISVLTRWKARHSTSVQVNFTLAWLTCGQIQGYMIGNVELLSGKKHALKGLLLVFVLYGYSCVAGFYVVAQEMLEFGTCKAL